jgi:hypothetical protein
MSENSSTPRRRWFAFSLRTLFVVVTLFAVVLGWVMWQRQIVRERRAMRDWLAERAWVVPDASRAVVPVYIGQQQPQPGPLGQKLATIKQQRQVHATLSLVRRWFGDESVDGICLTEALTGRHAEFERLFPEAIVVLESGAMADDPETERQMRQALSTPTDFSLMGASLQSALDLFRVSCGLSFQLDTDTLRKAGVDENTPLGFEANDIPLEEALAKLLEPLKLTFIVRHGVVTITTEDGVQEYKTTFPGYPDIP